MFSGIPAETPFDLRFWLFGVHVRVHPMHWVISAVLGWGAADGVLTNIALWVVCVFFSVLIHEMGHVLMGRLFGSDGHIVLFSFGGLAIGSSDLRLRWQRILVFFAGPFVQFVLLGLVILAAYFLLPRIAPNERSFLTNLVHLVLFTSPQERTLTENVFAMLIVINFFWPLLNLLPVWPLDGGKISRESLEGLFGQRGVIASLWVSIGVAGLLAVQVLMNTIHQPFIPYGWVAGSGIYMALFFALFCVSSIQALQIENRRSNRWDDELPWER